MAFKTDRILTHCLFIRPDSLSCGQFQLLALSGTRLRKAKRVAIWRRKAVIEELILWKAKDALLPAANCQSMQIRALDGFSCFCFWQWHVMIVTWSPFSSLKSKKIHLIWHLWLNRSCSFSFCSLLSRKDRKGILFST